ncbi:unnamed protein product, partial [Sphacelaria rigidula]
AWILEHCQCHRARQNARKSVAASTSPDLSAVSVVYVFLIYTAYSPRWKPSLAYLLRYLYCSWRCPPPPCIHVLLRIAVRITHTLLYHPPEQNPRRVSCPSMLVPSVHVVVYRVRWIPPPHPLSIAAQVITF